MDSNFCGDHSHHWAGICNCSTTKCREKCTIKYNHAVRRESRRQQEQEKWIPTQMSGLLHIPHMIFPAGYTLPQSPQRARLKADWTLLPFVVGPFCTIVLLRTADTKRNCIHSHGQDKLESRWSATCMVGCCTSKHLAIWALPLMDENMKQPRVWNTLHH